MYKPVDPKVNFPQQEESIVQFWEENDVFRASVSQREGAPDFVFYDGPPFATGLPHFGHFVPGTIKDIVPRYKTMRGYRVERRFGWDCHGLPVENLIEKELGLNSKTDIERYGVANFNDACQASVLRYVKEWRQIVTRLGRWVDFDHDYKTMDADYMESIWWVIKALWDKGLIYEGYYILPYCPRCSTVLSNHELSLGGYKDVHDPAISVRFRITSVPATSSDPDLATLADGATYFVAWTTTPWTLPSNLALALGPDIDYVCVNDGGERYILAESRLAAYYKKPESLDIAWKKKGRELAGIRYEPLFPYFASLAEQGAFVTVLGDHVTTEDGSGIVHTAPGFGEDDYQVLKGTGIPTVCPVDAECRFTDEVSDYKGLFVKEADKAIIEQLKAEGKLIKREQILHAYPHCWRCQSPLIYRAVSSWFVKIEPIKEAMLNANRQIYWLPGHIRDGRFGKWLENARDWAISRNRYWGNPIPIWKCDACGHTHCVGSRRELAELGGEVPSDLHKHHIDAVTFPCPQCGGTMRRVPEVLDCWFESGAMPYAQNHYPFENKEKFEAHFPADFICEGLDQTRGWFYTLTILAAALFDSPAFKACVVNGLVLAEDGKKMSKSLRNYTDPKDVMDRFGADALRFFLMNSAVTKAEDLCYSDEGVREVLKSVILPLWNAYSFFVTYANIDGFQADSMDCSEVTNPLDRWILSVCEKMVQDSTAGYEAYDMQAAIAPTVDFIDSLNNWYIRRSRRRFWKSENDADKRHAYATLYRVLRRLILVMAPVVPFVTEAIYRNLRMEHEPISIHLCDWPEYDASYRDLELEREMGLTRKAVSMGRALRVANDIKIRQPLASVRLITTIEAERQILSRMEDMLREELNVKEVLILENEQDLVTYRGKANFRVLGKELGADMKEAAQIIADLPSETLAAILRGEQVEVVLSSGRKVTLDAQRVEIVREERPGLKVLNEGTLTVALDTSITQELLQEGYIRDLIRGIQNARKEAGFEVTDRIRLQVWGDSDLQAALTRFISLVAGETLASDIQWSKPAAGLSVEAGDKVWEISVAKA
ncbi:MAG: isoleucine--tRNA ligase [Spirochaetaceae bacterium]|nr:isoleucine--tRNA ligase [Spirochaetaceae bacterium]